MVPDILVIRFPRSFPHPTCGDINPLCAMSKSQSNLSDINKNPPPCCCPLIPTLYFGPFRQCLLLLLRLENGLPGLNAQQPVRERMIVFRLGYDVVSYYRSITANSGVLVMSSLSGGLQHIKE